MQTEKTQSTTPAIEQSVGKVPELVLIFWVIKIAATTLGETGGDAVSMSMDLGYLLSTAIFAVIFLIAVMDNPFRGEFSVQPTAFKLLLDGLMTPEK